MLVWRYIIRRLLSLIPVIIGISLFVFLLMHLTPGDPAQLMLGEGAPAHQLEALRESMGLNKPWYVQYLNWLKNAVKLDLGRSLRSGKAVSAEIMDRLPATAELAAAAVAIAILLGVPVGVLSASRPNSTFDNVAMVGALSGVGMPAFWQGIMLILVFSVSLQWLPSSGRLGGWQYLVLPAITLGTGATASIARLTRSAMLDVLQQDYVRTARAKGLRPFIVVYWHALRNALIPVVTMIGLQFGGLMSGAVLTETIFAWPGIGRMLVEAINNKDFPLVQGTIMTFALTYALVNLGVDLMYAVLDPRLRSTYE
jgi:peptide/nickel transport system permease protein